MSDAPTDEGAPAPEPAPAAPADLHGAPCTEVRGQRVVHPARERLVEVVLALHGDGYRQLLDLCAVDYLTHPGRSGLPEGVAPERYEVVVTLLSHEARERLRLRVQVPADDPVVPSLLDVHPGADAMEREAFDLFGVRFDGHPDLSRILLPEDWEGHPLRKDHAVGRVPVQFKGVAPSR